MNILKYFSSITLLSAALVTAILYTFPASIYDMAISAERIYANVNIASKKINNIEISYWDNQQMDKPVIVLVHGFSHDKGAWRRLAPFLTKNYRLIALDLPGHGESTSRLGGDYRVRQQASYIHSFTQALGLPPFHIVGNSMGGHISGIYAAQYPDDILSIIYINNGGIQGKHPSIMMDKQKKAVQALIPETVEEFNTMLDSVFVKKPFMPSPIRQYYFDTYQATRIDLNWHVIQQLHVINRQGQGSFKYRYPIDDILPTIDKPGLIIWGMSDSLLSPNIPSLMQVYAPHLELYQIHNSGHTPMLESPKKTALAIERFITAQK